MMIMGQEKNKLVNIAHVKKIFVIGNSEVGQIIAEDVQGVDILLGEYKSMKRAYLILEEILERFGEGGCFGPSMTYQMPKE